MSLSIAERVNLCVNPVARSLLRLMHEKQTNLSVAVDVTTEYELLSIVEAIGSEICVLKTHIDILDNFSDRTSHRLSALAEKHRFLIFEDRKFADIGNTSKMQYGGGVYRIADWAHITNAHVIPGPGIIEGLQQIGLPRERGLLLLAEMSSQGSLAVGSYTEQAIAMAKAYPDFVIGFVAKRKLDPDPRFLTFTPGVRFSQGSDNIGQQYLTPQQVIAENHSDIIIVGRDIIHHANPREAARQYREAGWLAATASCT